MTLVFDQFHKHINFKFKFLNILPHLLRYLNLKKKLFYTSINHSYLLVSLKNMTKMKKDVVYYT